MLTSDMPAIRAAAAVRVQRVFIVSLLGKVEEERGRRLQALHAQHACRSRVPGTLGSSLEMMKSEKKTRRRPGTVPGLLQKATWLVTRSGSRRLRANPG